MTFRIAMWYVRSGGDTGYALDVVMAALGRPIQFMAGGKPIHRPTTFLGMSKFWDHEVELPVRLPGGRVA